MSKSKAHNLLTRKWNEKTLSSTNQFEQWHVGILDSQFSLHQVVPLHYLGTLLPTVVCDANEAPGLLLVVDRQSPQDGSYSRADDPHNDQNFAN